MFFDKDILSMLGYAKNKNDEKRTISNTCKDQKKIISEMGKYTVCGGAINLRPKVKLRSLWGTWPELDIETVSKEIIEDREHEEKIEKERERSGHD